MQTLKLFLFILLVREVRKLLEVIYQVVERILK